MSETQGSTQFSAERMVEAEDAEATQGRSENIIAYGAVALVSLAAGFLIGLLF